MLPLGQIIHHHKLSYTDNVSQHQPLQSPLFSTSSKTSNWTLGCGSRVVAPHSGWYLSWCGRIFPAPVRWRNYPQPGCPLVRYPPVVIIYQIHSDSGHYAETTIHTCSISLTEAWTGCSMLRTHLPECTPGNTSTWISNKILLTYKSLYAIAPGTFQTFSAKRLLSCWVLGAVARTLWKHTPLSALKCLDCIFKKQLIKTVMYSLRPSTWVLWNVLFILMCPHYYWRKAKANDQYNRGFF